MAFHDSLQIPILHNEDQEPLRLLELPLELLTALSTENPPTLTLKSATSSSHLHNDLVTSQQAVLCTPTQTYDIKQVQSSNTLLLLRPTVDVSDDGSLGTDMCAFATCAGTLELLSIVASEKTKSPRECLLALLPIYEADTNIDSIASPSKTGLLSDIPYSEGQLHAAWTDLTAFEASSKSFRPSHQCLINIWRTAGVLIAAMGSKMTDPVPYRHICDEVSDGPPELLEAMFRALCHSMTDEHYSARATFDRAKTVAWIGNLVLAAASEELSQPLHVLLEQWKSLVPEPWQKDATKEAMMKLDGYKKRVKEGAMATPQATSQDTKTDGKRKSAAAGRNWHEKFRRTNK